MKKKAKPEPAKVEKRESTGAGMTEEGGRVLMDGHPVYLWNSTNGNLVPVTSLKAIKGKTIWWRESEISFLKYAEL